jgi:hypothetical protein
VVESDCEPIFAVAEAFGRYPAKAVGTFSSVARTSARCELSWGLLT